MNWSEIIIYTSKEGIEPLSGRLYNTGIIGIQIEDEEDFLDFLENNKKYWDYVDDDLYKQKKCETNIKCYISDNSCGHELFNSVKAAVKELKNLDTDNKFGRLEIEIKNRDEAEWIDNWKKYFKPFNVGEKLLIKPSWENVDNTENRIIVEIEPGQLFGTGLHATTQLCLINLEKFVKKDMEMLDLGCGSGILSIAGVLLGAKNVLAVDIDENAHEIVKNNVILNKIDLSQIIVKSGNVTEDEDLYLNGEKNKYNIITANIVADVILSLIPNIKTHLLKDGIFIMSGIIDIRKDEITDSLKINNYEIISIEEKEGWVSIAAK